MDDFNEMMGMEFVYPGSLTGEVKGVCGDCQIEWIEQATDDELLECPQCGEMVEKKSVFFS